MIINRSYEIPTISASGDLIAEIERAHIGETLRWFISAADIEEQRRAWKKHRIKQLRLP